jgi:hypothetical protein
MNASISPRLEVEGGSPRLVGAGALSERSFAMSSARWGSLACHY